MKLQVNDSGAWRNLVDFSSDDVEVVKAAASVLGERAVAAGQERIAFRILDSQRTTVLMWGRGAGWTVPHWAQDYTWVP